MTMEFLYILFLGSLKKKRERRHMLIWMDGLQCIVMVESRGRVISEEKCQTVSNGMGTLL